MALGYTPIFVKTLALCVSPPDPLILGGETRKLGLFPPRIGGLGGRVQGTKDRLISYSAPAAVRSNTPPRCVVIFIACKIGGPLRG